MSARRIKYRPYTKAEALAWLAREKNRIPGRHDAAVRDAAVCALNEGGATWAEVAEVIGISVSAVKRRYASDSRLPRSLVESGWYDVARGTR